MVTKVRPRSAKKTVLLYLQPDGAFRAYDDASRTILKGKGWRAGQVVSAELKAPRNLPAWTRAHQLGTLLREHVESFETCGDSHEVLKRLQVETGQGCDEIWLKLDGVIPVSYRIPQSLAFDQMDDGEFNSIYAAFCEHVRRKYWPGLDDYVIEDMAKITGHAA